MPIIEVPDDPGMRGVTGEAPTTPPVPLLGDVLGASFRQSNSLVSWAADQHSHAFKSVPGYSALPEIKGTPYYDRHLNRFVGSSSSEETQSIKNQIDMEERDQQTNAAAGGLGIVAGMAAGTIDPIIAFPVGGVAAKVAEEGYVFGRSALATARAVALGTTAQEAILQASQETRPLSESVLNIGSATLLGAILGEGAAKLLAPEERAALTKTLNQERAAMHEHVTGERLGDDVFGGVSTVRTGDDVFGAQTTPHPANENAGIPLAKAAGAAATDTRTLELAPAFGAEKLTKGFDPMSRLLNSESTSARRAAVDLAETPLSFKENAEGIATTQGPSLERMAKLVISKTRVAVSDELTRLFSEYRFGDADVSFPRMRAQWEGFQGRGEGHMTYEGFKQAVSEAMTRGDKSDIPQIQSAAQYVRSRVFDPWKERAIKAGLLPDDVGVKTADSYFQRVYNKQAIAAKRPEFVNTIQSWLKSDQAAKASTQQRLAWLNGQLNSWNDQLAKLARRAESVDAKGADLVARLKERSMEVGRAEGRVDALQERESLLAGELSDLQEFIDEMRKDVTDPQLRAEIDNLQRDVSAARAADRPMTQAQLEQRERDELGGILTGQVRMAAEMLTGRRAYPRGASFLSWLVKQGGLKDTGGDVRFALGGAQSRPGLINHTKGLQIDRLAERIREEAPGRFGADGPSDNQILGWIRDSAHGQEPDWWHSTFSNDQQAHMEAARYADAMDEMLTRAGVDLKKPSDFAKLLRDGQISGVTLADLDKIAADMEAAGAGTPPSISRQAAEDRHAAGVQEIRDLRQVIEKAMDARSRKNARLREAEAQTGEADYGVRQSRSRLGILEDRLAQGDIKRELIEEAQAIAQKQHDEVRGKIEQELGAWEGKSASEAKGALKAREKYATERGRGPDEPRLRSADKAVDRTVRRILESDRDLSDAELRSRAHEIVERILGSPDGRLPYDIGMGGPEIGYRAAASSEPPRGALSSREFNIPDELIRPWLEQDVEHVANTHLRTMVPDTLLAERFGDTRMTEAFRKIEDDYAALIDKTKSEGERTKLGKEREAALRDLAAIRDRIRGVYGFPVYQSMRGAARVAAAVKNYNVVSSMGMAAVSSLPDMAGAVFRHGLGSAFSDAWVPWLKSMMGWSDAWKEARSQFRAMGIATETMTAQRHHALADIMDTYKPQSRVERTLQWGADKFQLLNGLAAWTDWGKVNASLIASSEILKAAKQVAAGNGTARQLGGLAENGIDRHMADRIRQAFEAGGEVRDGVHLPNTADWADGAARDAFEGAVSREADIAIVTPGQEKPLWLSNPVVSVLGQFKSFTAAGTQRILIANLQRHDAQVLQGVLFSMGLGMISYKINAVLGGQPTSDRPQDWIKESISRGNLLGWFEEGNALASKMTRGGVDVYRLLGSDHPLSRYASRSVLDQLLGPTAGKIEAITQVTGAAASRDWSASDTRALRRLTAMQNLFYLRGLFNQVEAGANSAFGIPATAPKH